jgi:prepilin-type N-terminal cleavage/methylation domain-containing protein
MTKLRMKKGFTLIELMIVVAIIGILAAIAIPQFAQLISKSQEGATKGNLGTLRSSLSIYYGDTEGLYPLDAASLILNSKYLQAIPPANLPKTVNSIGHGSHNGFLQQTFVGMTAAQLEAGAGGANPWAYDNAGAGSDAQWGTVLIACSHSDTKGSFWTQY